MKTLSPTCDPVITSASMILWWNCLHMSLVPLHKPCLGSKLRRSIIGAFSFSLKECGGKPPPSSREFKNSIVYRILLQSDVHIESALTYSLSTPTILLRAKSLIASTSLLRGARTPLSLKNCM